MIISKNTRLTLKRIMWAFIPSILVLGLGVVVLDFYLIHRLTHPVRTQLYGSPRDFQVILQKPMWFDDKWKNSDSTETVGWFLSRGKPAPAIILSHGYGSNRSELLTLGFELWKSGYHVLIYDLRGHGESPVNWSGLGTYEKDDLLSAISFLKSRKTDSGQELLDGRVGLYGVDLGGYISLVASSQDPTIKAVAVDSVYRDVDRFIIHRFTSLVGTDSGWANSLVESSWASKLTRFAMQAYLMRQEDSPMAIDSVGSGSGRSFMFITANDTGMFDAMTRELHGAARDPKSLVEVEKTRLTRLYDQHSSSYDAQVVGFFRNAIPPNGEKKNPVLRASK